MLHLQIFNKKRLNIWNTLVDFSIDIASTKAYSLGRRSHYRDYIDLFYIIKSGITLQRIIKSTVRIYKNAFNPKLFLAQLTYFDDINKRENSFNQTYT